MLSILCLKRKAKNSVSGLVWMLPTSSEENQRRGLLFVLIVERRRIKLFTLKITLNISMVGVQYTLIVQLWNNVAFHAVIWHILGVERFSCNHLSHICLWYDIHKNKKDWCYTFSTTFRGTLNGQNFGLDFHLQIENDLQMTA